MVPLSHQSDSVLLEELRAAQILRKKIAGYEYSSISTILNSDWTHDSKQRARLGGDWLNKICGRALRSNHKNTTKLRQKQRKTDTSNNRSSLAEFLTSKTTEGFEVGLVTKNYSSYNRMDFTGR